MSTMRLIAPAVGSPPHDSEHMPVNLHDEDFIARLQSLSPELFNLVLNFTLRHKTDEVISVNRTWRPPSTLQVNHHSRAAGAQVYYGANSFDFGSSEISLEECYAWLKAICPAHAQHITNLRLGNVAGSEMKPLLCPKFSALRVDVVPGKESFNDPVFASAKNFVCAVALRQGAALRTDICIRLLDWE